VNASLVELESTDYDTWLQFQTLIGSMHEKIDSIESLFGCSTIFDIYSDTSDLICFDVLPDLFYLSLCIIIACVVTLLIRCLLTTRAVQLSTSGSFNWASVYPYATVSNPRE
jgi:hypothetical protein